MHKLFPVPSVSLIMSVHKSRMNLNILNLKSAFLTKWLLKAVPSIWGNDPKRRLVSQKKIEIIFPRRCVSFNTVKFAY